MNRGRPPLPSALRAPAPSDKDETPESDGEQLPPDMPDCPDFLHPYAKEEWASAAPALYALGVLTDMDEKALAGYCQAVARWRLAEELLTKAAEGDADKLGALVATTDSGNKVQSVLLTVANGAMRDMLRFAAEFGMTPSARARIEGKRGSGPDTTQGKYFGKRTRS